jgi:hypothetical protein
MPGENQRKCGKVFAAAQRQSITRMKMKIVQGRVRRGLVLLAICFVFVAVPAAQAQVRSSDFDVTDRKIRGAKGHRLMISTKEIRAILNLTTEQSATLKFTYLGPTKEVAHLGSGEVRSQFGIKLRAQNDCNVVYIMCPSPLRLPCQPLTPVMSPRTR